MPDLLDLRKRTSHAKFAAMVGISRPAVSDMVARGVLPRGGSAGTWLKAYVKRLLEEASTRSDANQPGLTEARTREANAKAEAVEIQNVEKLGTIVLAEDLEPLLEELREIVRERVMAAYERVSELVSKKYGVVLVASDLLVPIQTALGDCHMPAGTMPGFVPGKTRLMRKPQNHST